MSTEIKRSAGIAINPHIFRKYDIRGVADFDPADGEARPHFDLTPKQAWLIGRAFGTWLKHRSGNRAVVGRDSRGTSLDLANSVAVGLLSTGCEVIDIGLSTTPMCYFAVDYLDAHGGVMVTGSHNPMSSNGFKLSKEHFQTLVETDIQALYQLILAEDFTTGQGRYWEQEISAAYEEAIVQRVRSATRPIRVVVDPGNAVGGLLAPGLLRRLGYQVSVLNGELKYPFPKGSPDPEQPAKVRELAQQVAALGADIGIAYDGDADRIGVIDESGQKIESDLLLLLYARAVLRENPGAAIVFDVKCTDLLIDDIRSHGGVPVMSKTGHSNIKQKMMEMDSGDSPALLGGELSGHMFFKDRYFGFDDALYATCRILEILSESDLPLSEMLAELPETFTTRELALPCPDESKSAVIRDITSRLKRKGLEVIDIDGARIRFGKHQWALVRQSNTQPKLTARLQASSAAQLQENIEMMLAELGRFDSVELDELQVALQEV